MREGESAMKRTLGWFKRQAVLTAAWVLALASMALVPPDRNYAGYVDWRTLELLFCLMAVMAGARRMGLFRRMGEALLSRAADQCQLEGVLVLLCFCSSMVITNDVALITFVPFAGEVLELAGRQRRLVPLVAAQTIAANLGSMLSPIGNPQNLYLYSWAGVSAGAVTEVMLPYGALSALGLAVLVLSAGRAPLSVPAAPAEPLPRRSLALHGGLFLLCLLAVARVLPAALLTAVVLAALLLWDRPALRQVDYGLLLTFAGFFLFVGNMGRLPVLREALSGVLSGHEVVTAVAASQVISNVPAALLLSGFTRNWQALLVGTNLGGLGTLIASMASLISYQYVAARAPEQKGRYLLYFTGLNAAFLAALLAEWALLGGI